MPHKPSTSRNAAVQFVSVSLTVALKPKLKEWAEAEEKDLVGHLARAVQLGYRVTVKAEDEGYAANMAPVRLEGPNSGLVLVERGSTPERALLRLLWAHESYFNRVWPRDKVSQGDDW